MKELLTAKILSKPFTALALSGVGAVGGTVSIIEQLNTLYPFLYMMLPLWVFFALIVSMCIVGAMGALLTDVMNTKEGHTLRKVGIAIWSGLVSSFVIIPTFIAEPSMGTLLLTGLGASFSGTILLFIVTQTLKDTELQASLKNTIKNIILAITSRLGGSKK